MGNFFKQYWWEIIKGIVAAITIAMVYFGFPERTEKLIKQVEETHTYVKGLSESLKDNIEGGQDVSVGISKNVSDRQIILISNCKLNFKVGDSIVLHNHTSDYKPKITLLIASIEDPSTPFEYDGKVQMYINKNAVKMLDYDPKVGTKKLKIMQLESEKK
ncbi:hypothetical protein [Sulfuricurvum sp.]|uniref:hypothetical protein n=1 Tax=Sulfuricurvum sp. TaxID=2025608 RepID=UPI003BB72804